MGIEVLETSQEEKTQVKIPQKITFPPRDLGIADFEKIREYGLNVVYRKWLGGVLYRLDTTQDLGFFAVDVNERGFSYERKTVAKMGEIVDIERECDLMVLALLMQGGLEPKCNLTNPIAINKKTGEASQVIVRSSHLRNYSLWPVRKMREADASVFI